MKKEYFAPEMKITAFSTEDIVTTSVAAEPMTTINVNGDAVSATKIGEDKSFSIFDQKQ